MKRIFVVFTLVFLSLLVGAYFAYPAIYPPPNEFKEELKAFTLQEATTRVENVVHTYQRLRTQFPASSSQTNMSGAINFIPPGMTILPRDLASTSFVLDLEHETNTQNPENPITFTHADVTLLAEKGTHTSRNIEGTSEFIDTGDQFYFRFVPLSVSIPGKMDETLASENKAWYLFENSSQTQDTRSLWIQKIKNFTSLQPNHPFVYKVELLEKSKEDMLSFVSDSMLWKSMTRGGRVGNTYTYDMEIARAGDIQTPLLSLIEETGGILPLSPLTDHLTQKIRDYFQDWEDTPLVGTISFNRWDYSIREVDLTSVNSENISLRYQNHKHQRSLRIEKKRKNLLALEWDEKDAQFRFQITKIDPKNQNPTLALIEASYDTKKHALAGRFRFASAENVNHSFDGNFDVKLSGKNLDDLHASLQILSDERIALEGTLTSHWEAKDAATFNYPLVSYKSYAQYTQYQNSVTPQSIQFEYPSLGSASLQNIDHEGDIYIAPNYRVAPPLPIIQTFDELALSFQYDVPNFAKTNRRLPLSSEDINAIFHRYDIDMKDVADDTCPILLLGEKWDRENKSISYAYILAHWQDPLSTYPQPGPLSLNYLSISSGSENPLNIENTKKELVSFGLERKHFECASAVYGKKMMEYFGGEGNTIQSVFKVYPTISPGTDLFQVQ